jgi:protein-tyrosine phosphatase
MIDLHSHVLPGIDDGPADAAGSLALLRAAAAAGTTTLAATPHIDWTFGLGPDDLERPLALVRAVAAANGVAVDVVLGAEIALDRYVDLGPDELGPLSLGDGPYLLLEPPLSQAAGPFDRLLHARVREGTPILLAHPERCPAFQRRPALLGDLVRGGALGQVTAASLAGRFGRTVREAAMAMLAAGQVHVLASDAHDAQDRGPDLREGLEAAARALPGSAALADWLTVDVPGAVLAGAPVPRRPALPMPPPRRGWRARLARRP